MEEACFLLQIRQNGTSILWSPLHSYAPPLCDHGSGMMPFKIRMCGGCDDERVGWLLAKIEMKKAVSSEKPRVLLDRTAGGHPLCVLA